MSLLANAAPWNDNNDKNKKRFSTMRKTQKKKPLENDDNDVETDFSFNEKEFRPSSFDEDQKTQEDRQDRVSKMISNMSSLEENNDGSNLENFTPLSPPDVQKMNDYDNSTYGRNGEEEQPPIYNDLRLQPPKIRSESANFGPSVSDLGISNNPQQTNPYSNYRKIYEPSRVQIPDNYYSKMGLGTQSTVDNKLLEKINYMIHMLEQQQNEKTSNITEEFILYTFLGVFIIFIVDSFSRTGKYIR